MRRVDGNRLRQRTGDGLERALDDVVGIFAGQLAEVQGGGQAAGHVAERAQSPADKAFSRRVSVMPVSNADD